MTIPFRFIYKDINGQLQVVWPMSQYVNEQLALGISLDAIKQTIINKDVLPYCPSGEYHEVDFETAIPTDRYFRNAWDHDDTGAVLIDRPKAEAIHMDKLRAIRDDKLKQLDIDYMKALETSDTSSLTSLADQKNQLRNLPQTTDLSIIPLEELKDYIPDLLKEKK